MSRFTLYDFAFPQFFGTFARFLIHSDCYELLFHTIYVSLGFAKSDLENPYFLCVFAHFGISIVKEHIRTLSSETRNISSLKSSLPWAICKMKSSRNQKIEIQSSAKSQNFIHAKFARKVYQFAWCLL